MLTTSDLARCRQLQESIMRDTVLIEELLGDPVFDPETGTTTRPTRIVYDGKATVQVEARGATEQPAGEGQARIQRYACKVPAAVTDLTAHLRVTVTATQFDPDLVGRVFTITEVERNTFATARRFFAADQQEVEDAS